MVPGSATVASERGHADLTAWREPTSGRILPSSMTAVRYQLPNGLRVVLQENHAAKVVAFQAWVAVGSADESPEMAGIAHVFEHMLFKGTARRGVGQIAHEVEAAGGEINAWTSFDQTVYHLVLAVALLRHRARYPGRRAAELLVRSRGVGARIESSARRGEAGRGQPVAGGHAGALRRRLLAPPLSPPGHRLHQDGQVVHARAAARLLPALVRGQQRDARGGRRLRRQARAGGHRRGVGQDGLASAGAPRAQGAGAEVGARQGRHAGRARDPGQRRLPHPGHPPRRHGGARCPRHRPRAGRLVASDARRSSARDQLVTDAYAYAYTPRDPGLLVAGATLPPARARRPPSPAS